MGTSNNSWIRKHSESMINQLVRTIFTTSLFLIPGQCQSIHNLSFRCHLRSMFGEKKLVPLQVSTKRNQILLLTFFFFNLKNPSVRLFQSDGQIEKNEEQQKFWDTFEALCVPRIARSTRFSQQLTHLAHAIILSFQSLLCGQHCLNNLLQGYYFDAVILANIAQELDEEEGRLIDGKNVCSSLQNIS